MGILQTRIQEWVVMPPPPGNLPNSGIKPRCLSLQADSLPSEPTEKPKNTGVSNLFLLQGVFLIQEANQGLLHGRQILYQLSYQGSFIKIIYNYKGNKIFLKRKNSAKVRYHEPLKRALMDGIQPTKEGRDKLLHKNFQMFKLDL